MLLLFWHPEVAISSKVSLVILAFILVYAWFVFTGSMHVFHSVLNLERRDVFKNLIGGKKRSAFIIIIG